MLQGQKYLPKMLNFEMVNPDYPAVYTGSEEGGAPFMGM